MNITGIPSAEVEGLWPQVAPFVESALEHAHGELDLTDILDALRAHRMQLVIAHDERIHGACVTEIANYPRTRRIRIVTIGGRRAFGWAGPLRDYLIGWCKAEGYSGIEGYSRTDTRYLKFLERMGAQRAYVVTLLELPE